MSHKVELRHGNTKGGKLFEIKVEWWEVSGEPAMEVDTPLACNVIGHKDAADPGVEVVSDRRCEGVVRIHVSMEMGD